ncbi:MAG: 2OG-Fe(II) oxygenase [Undibacterium sp.]|uniref:2OG-Fe(II) oxygenase n=1 Tax=Undibacterium sp. TaxID=1914977 RepID=UPI00271A5F0F|nr:2OG-Fe(II) oxygenase [Undibacterium sp.]MDO8653369.1 2OG-Fe(II) oxygenase [Undibacterium sp.]
MLSIASTSTHIRDDTNEFLKLQQRFQHTHAIILSDILEHQLLNKLQKILETIEYFPRVIPVGIQDVGKHNRASSILNLVLARPALYRWLENLLDCDPIIGVEGAVMRLSHGQCLDWHDDMNDERRALAITICLSDRPYQGGEFQIRRKKTKELLFSHLHSTLGTAVIFEINRELEHRVQEIHSAESRIVYAGWFLKGKST